MKDLDLDLHPDLYPYLDQDLGIYPDPEPDLDVDLDLVPTSHQRHSPVIIQSSMWE